MWQAKTIWTKTFPCFYRGVFTSDNRLVSQDTVIHRRLPAPVLVSVPGVSPFNDLIGQVTYLNEADDGTFFADVELTRDPSTLPSGLYPEVDFGPGPCRHEGDHCAHACKSDMFIVVSGFIATGPEITFLGMHLGIRPVWPDLRPVT